MSDIAENLLAQYYGFPEESKAGKSLSIQECAKNARNDVGRVIGKRSIDINGDETPSRKTKVEGNNVESEKKNSEDNIPSRSSRVLIAFKGDKETLSNLDITFKVNAMSNFGQNVNSSGKETHIAIRSDKTVSTYLGAEDKANDLYLSLVEDILPDCASDVSSVTEKKKPKEFLNTFISSATSSPNKIPIYNETFIDVTSIGLKFLPVETIKEYSTIRMLYLENNNLSELPKELFVFMPHLQWLDVRNNQLIDLPTSIKSHSSLETILLQGNKIEKLPLELCLVPKLKTLNVAHNPIVSPPKHIIALGCLGILDYLRNEWNKLHPNETIAITEQETKSKLSTILCYQTPREKGRKLSRIVQRASKSTSDVGNLLKSASSRKRGKAYKPSNRYNDHTQSNAFLENSINVISERDITRNDDVISTVCASCAQSLAAIRYQNDKERVKKGNENDNEADATRYEKYDDRRCSLRKMITLCDDVKRRGIPKNDAEADAKILCLMGPSPRSCYIRQNVMELITYKRYRERECRIKAISNETKHIALAKSDNFIAFKDEAKRCRDEHAELVFDVITKDMRKMQLRPMQLKDSRYILSCLENYLGIRTN